MPIAVRAAWSCLEDPGPLTPHPLPSAVYLSKIAAPMSFSKDHAPAPQVYHGFRFPWKRPTVHSPVRPMTPACLPPITPVQAGHPGRGGPRRALRCGGEGCARGVTLKRPSSHGLVLIKAPPSCAMTSLEHGLWAREKTNGLTKPGCLSCTQPQGHPRG